MAVNGRFTPKQFRKGFRKTQYTADQKVQIDWRQKQSLADRPTLEMSHRLRTMRRLIVGLGSCENSVEAGLEFRELKKC
jgi:hypothetical protein